MFHALTTALRQIRDELATVLAPATIRAACAAVGHRWRDRQLDPVTTIHLFILQILHGNTACAHLPRLTGRTFSASAYCQARGRLPLAVLQHLLRRTCEAIRPVIADAETWRGHRTWLVDGTGVSMPDTPDLQQAFGQPTNQAPGCGFPVARMFALFHAGTGFLTRMLIAPLRSHEAAHVANLHPEMATGDVLVGDRAFGTFAHLAGLLARGLHGVFRLHAKRVVDFTPERSHPPRWNGPTATGRSRARWLRSLGAQDQVVEWFKGYQRPRWMTAAAFAALPVTLTVRELRYVIDRPGFRVRTVTLVTTLLDPVAYPARALAQLYWSRWRVETNLAHLKTTLGMDVLRCQTEVGVQKELTLFAVVYNLVRAVMAEAGRRQDVPPDQISFVDALRWLSSSPPGTPLPTLIVNPDRPGRVEPRCQKRRAKKYPYMIRPRAELRKQLMEQPVAA
jgi:hypothetical protein